MAFKLICSSVYLILFITNLQAVNILVLEEVASPSHHLWMRTVTTQLAAMGYNVTTLSADTDKETIPNLHPLHLDMVYKKVYELPDMDFLEKGAASKWVQMNLYYDYAFASCEGAIISKGWKQLESYPDNFKFDLVIHDYALGQCQLAFLAKFNYPPIISLSGSSDLVIAASLLKSVLTPSITPYYLLTTEMDSFAQRFKNYIFHVVDTQLRDYYFYPEMDKILQRLNWNIKIPSVHELSKKTSLIMFNHDPVFDLPEQLPPNIIDVGGLQIRKPTANSLSSDFQEILNNAKNGLILFSLGTNVPIHSIGEDRLTHIFNAFGKLPQYTFLCKFQVDALPSFKFPKNVVLRPWIPQNDVLGHPNTKLFITHSGLLSTQESIWHAVPIIAMPVFYDQFLNAEKTVVKGFGESVFWPKLTADLLYQKLVNVLTNPSYQNKLQDASHIFRDRIDKPLDRAIWWIEWSIRNPNVKFYSGAGKDLNFIQRQSIDVLFLIFAIFILICWILIKIIKIIFSFCIKPNRINKKKIE